MKVKIDHQYAEKIISNAKKRLNPITLLYILKPRALVEKFNNKASATRNKLENNQNEEEFIVQIE